MKNIIKTKKGFTLVELVIVIVIVGILSVISVPIYRGYVEHYSELEAKTPDAQPGDVWTVRENLRITASNGDI